MTRKNTRIALVAVACSGLMLVCGPASAAPVNWGAVFEIVTDTDIDTSAAIVAAVNGGPAGAADIAVTVGSTVLTFVSPDPSVFASANLGAGGGPDIAPTGNVELDELFESHTWQTGDHSVDTVPMTVSGLVSGRAYQIQIIAAADGRSCCLTRSQAFQDTADGSGNNSGDLLRASDVGMTGSLYATSVIGTFTADGATQDLWMSGVQDPGISGYVVSNVPEPSSLVILVLGCLGLVSSRARKRA